VIVVDENGGRTSHIADGHQAAQRLVEKLKEQVAAPTAELIEEWFAAKLASGTCLEQTVMNQRHQIHQLLGRQVCKPARSLKPETAAALYADYSARCVVATHRLALRLTKSFWQWAVRYGHTALNPWLTVDAVGRVRVGKPQFRPSEARRFADVAEQEALAGSRIAVAVLLCLCCGLRVSEAIGLRRRDLDGNELFVEGTKTARARRRVTLPGWLLPHFARLTADTLPAELLFPHSRQTLFHTVKRLCRAAGTPITCPHGLRATWASAAVTGGATVEAVAATMGHSSTRVTLRHYVERDAVVNAQVAAFDRLLKRSAGVPPG
jgi:integrase